MKPADAGVSIGQVFQGKYRVDAILGQGGMGVVAECTHLALNERVAIKMLRPDVVLDHDAVSRFIREAQAAVKLKSEYVARVSDVGTLENGTPYMVMEFLEGHDLGELLKQRGVLPVQWAVELMLQTAEALAEAHSLSIVHRDVKPTNLFVTWRPDGSALIKVLDFGISKSPMGNDMQLTQTQSLLGTPAYMSPEQMRSARLVDTRTDIWSLGTVFYEILEGRRPFEADSFSEMCVKVAVDAPAPMINTPPALQPVILRALAKTPEQRYASMAEFAQDLVPFAADPHAGQMLVERMRRMLGRATYDWDANSAANRQSSQDLSSAAAHQAPLRRGTGSDPAAAPWSAKSDPAARAWHSPTPPPGDGSQPFAQPLPADQSQPYARPGADLSNYGATLQTAKKNRWPLALFILLVLAGGAVGIGLAVSGGGDDKAKTKTNVVEPTDKIEMKASDTKPVAPKTDVIVTQPSAPVETQPVETQPVATKAVEAKAIKKNTKATKTETKKAAAEVPALVPKVEAKPCDPFDSMHGCSAK